MADTLPTDQEDVDMPAVLPYPLSIHIRNSDLHVDESGNATRLDISRVVLTIKSQVNPGTVFFTNIDMRAMSTTARGLVRVISQQALGDGIGMQTLAEFVELSDDAKSKITRLLGGGLQGQPIPPAPQPIRNFATEQIGMQASYSRTAPARLDYQVASTEPRYFEPAPTRQKATATKSTQFFGSLGVTAYIIIFLIVVWFFPVGREYEILVWTKISWSFERIWYWATHIGDVKLYNNT
jgi:hypothetical protein